MSLLAVSSWSWHDAYYAGHWSLLDLPASAAAAGIYAIEGNDFMLPPPRLSRLRRPLLRLLPGCPPELWRYSRASLHQLQANARAHNVTLLAWTINSDFTVPAHQWPAQWLYLRRGLAAAQQLGVPLLRLNLGGQPDTPAARDTPIVRRLAHFAATAHRLCPTLQLTIENHWGISTDIARHVRLVDAVQAQPGRSTRAHLGCCFDPGNVPDEPQRSDWWRALAQRANHYHLKTAEFDATGREITLPHARLYRLLQELNYTGHVTIEYAGDGDPIAGVRNSVALWQALQASTAAPNKQHGSFMSAS